MNLAHDKLRTFLIFMLLSLVATTFTTVCAAPDSTSKTTIFARVTSKVAKPGDTLYFDVQITNGARFGDPVTYDLQVIDLPEGWKVRFFYQDEQVRSITLKPGETLTTRIEISTAPDSSTGIYPLTFMAYSWMAEYVNTQSLTVELREPIREVKITSAFPGVLAYVGDTIQHSILIQNKGELGELLKLSALAPDGWVVKFVSPDKSEVSSVYLAAGQSISLTVETSAPDNTLPGEYNLTVRASSVDGAVNVSIGLDVSLREKEVKSEFEFVSRFSEVTAEAGKSFTYPITLRNLSEDAQEIILSVLSSPEKWKIAFKSGDTEIARVALNPNQSIELVLQATPPSEVSVGDYSIAVEAKGESTSKQTVFRAKIVGLYRLDVQPSTLYTSATAGNQLTTTVRVTNSGQSPVTTLSIQVTAPSGWDVSYSPAKVPTLDPKASYTFTVIAIPPSTTVAGDYMISVKALSDQYTSDEVQIRVTVEAPTSWALAGVVVAVVAVAFLIIAFRKFSRR
ncbi:MAG: hypothetical protein APU95_03465 [Hadesarchaea archaeon YNP_N21]|nr:MAG: hypothetical protein APU95_03465 [Hadesarchaea archaeon YNP_N21]